MIHKLMNRKYLAQKNFYRDMNMFAETTIGKGTHSQNLGW